MPISAGFMYARVAAKPVKIPLVPTYTPNRAVFWEERQEMPPTQPSAEPRASMGAREGGARPVEGWERGGGREGVGESG